MYLDSKKRWEDWGLGRRQGDKEHTISRADGCTHNIAHRTSQRTLPSASSHLYCKYVPIFMLARPRPRFAEIHQVFCTPRVRSEPSETGWLQSECKGRARIRARIDRSSSTSEYTVCMEAPKVAHCLPTAKYGYGYGYKHVLSGRRETSTSSRESSGDLARGKQSRILFSLWLESSLR